MSGLETLPPDQRAVLQLILRQGRGYADLAGLLKIDVAAVRERAVAGAAALGGPAADAIAPDQRARIADYLLGQQDVAERIVTFAELADSATARHWAQALRERLAPLAHEPLPEVPPADASNGAAPAPTAAAPPTSPTPVPPAPPAPPSFGAPPGAAPSPRRPSRLGGAILIGGIVALVAVVLVVLLSTGGDDSTSASTGTTAAAARTTAPTTTARTTTTPRATILAQVNLVATPGNGKAVGLGIVEQGAKQKRAIAIQAQKLPANGQQDIYAVWLQGPPGPKFVGFVPQRVGANGGFTASAALPANVKSYTSVLVTREPTTAVPKQPGPTILSGALKLP